MKNFLLASTLASAAALTSFAAVAAPVTYVIDPGHSVVAFTLDHLGFAKAMGRFNTVGGELVFDAAAPASSSVTVEIDANTVDTNHAKRDEHLKSPDFFNSAEFPKITFKSDKVEVTGEKTGRLAGQLTMLGVTKPVVLDVTFNKVDVSPASKLETAGFSARGTVKRSDFGMSYGVPNIGDDVALIIEVEATKK